VAVTWVTQPLTVWGRSLPGDALPKIVESLAQHITVFFQVPNALLGIIFGVIGVVLVTRLGGAPRLFLAGAVVALVYAMLFVGEPLALIGSPYVILAAYAVRSLPASVRAGVAQLHQIDPAIEEASTSLGGDAGVTFRQITLPLILPAFMAGLIFAFARHMTSLSAIIFLTTPKWPILTALILSEVEQGGMSLAAAYSVILIAIVLGAIGLMYVFMGRVFGRRAGVDLTVGMG
jgi:iron(III) transport system permease protein